MTKRKENPQKAGRKKLYQTPAEMEPVCDAYIALIEQGKKGFVPTINGLARELGMDRESLMRYRDNPEYCGALKNVLTALQQWWEGRLAGNNCTGAIFWLKNQGWTDKTQHELSGSLSTMDNKQLDERIAALMSNPELMGSIGAKKP